MWYYLVVSFIVFWVCMFIVAKTTKIENQDAAGSWIGVLLFVSIFWFPLIPAIIFIFIIWAFGIGISRLLLIMNQLLNKK